MQEETRVGNRHTPIRLHQLSTPDTGAGSLPGASRIPEGLSFDRMLHFVLLAAFLLIGGINAFSRPRAAQNTLLAGGAATVLSYWAWRQEQVSGE